MARVEMPNSRARSAIANRSRFSLSGRFTAFSLHRLVLVAQLFLAELADERFGELVLEDDLARHLEFVEPLADERLELGLADRLPLLELDECHRSLAAILVRHADDVGFVHGRIGDQRLLDGARIDVET